MDVPEHLHSRFDIVHIRAFAAVIKAGNPEPLLRNLIQLLKPGGYLQWDEFDSNTFSAHAPSPSTTKRNAERIIQVWHEFAKRLSLTLDWMAPGAMRGTFDQFGLLVINDTKIDRWTGPDQVKHLVRKAYTDNWMMALEEVSFLIISRGGDAGTVISADDFGKLLTETTKETTNGVNIWIDLQVVVGQKPD